MAETIETWAEKIVEKTSEEATIIVDTNSNAGGLKVWQDIFAFILRTFEWVFDSKITAYVDKANDKDIEDWDYFYALVIAYQHLDTLAFLGNRYGYAVIDTTKQIVNVAQITEYLSNDKNGLLIHPGFQDANGDITKLTTFELATFEDYFEEVKPNGLRVSYSSAEVGNLIITMEIFYDPEKLNPDGSSFDDADVFPIVDAVKDYQDNYVNKNGFLRVTELRRRIAAVDGVEDMTFTKHRYDAAGGTTYTDYTGYEQDIDNLAQYNKAGTEEITYTEA